MISPDRMAEINAGTIDRTNMFYWQVDRPVTVPEFAEIFMGRHENFDEASVIDAIETALRGTVTKYAGSKVENIIGDSDYKSGSVNINRLVKLDHDREIVLKMHPVGLYNGYYNVEAAAMNAAREFIPTAQVISVRHDAPIGGYDFMLMEKMPGQNMKNYLIGNREVETSLVRDMGRKMASLHQVKVNGFGFFDNDYARSAGKLRGIHATFREHVLAALPENLSVLVGANYLTGSQAKKITQLLTESKLIGCESPRLLHNDMADWNVLTDGKTLTAILDWDECFAGDPVADVACWSLFFQPERLATFLEGYREIAGFGDDFEDKLHIYRLRYVVSKLSLRHRKSGVQKDNIMAGLIKAGLQALKDESAYFDL